ncbi:MAG: hypothetical protein EPN22_01750 [Nitrospirae bacterium]|nr:MAG: hypothetical protein EPN22_01750 [Nitrospirota bacterium]
MIGTKIYIKKTQAYFFLAMYALLAVIGGTLSIKPVLNEQSPNNAAGFMLVFGTGMFILTLIKIRKPQLSFFTDFIELSQKRTKQLVRYRNITAVNRPNPNSIVITLREDGQRTEVTIWLNELERSDIEKIYAFLSDKGWKK